MELQKQNQDNEAKHLVAEKLTVELRGSLAEKERALAGKIEELDLVVAEKDKLSAEAQRLRNTLREEAAQLTSQLTSARLSVTSLENEKAELDAKVAQVASQPSQEQTTLNEAQAARIQELQGKLASEQAAQQQAATLVEDHAQRLQVLLSKLELSKQQAADAEKKAEEAAASAKPISTMQAEIDSLQARLDAQAKSVAEHQQLKSEMESMQVRHADQLRELRAAESQSQSDSELVSSQSESGDLKAELRAQEKRIMELESENHETHEKLAAMVKLRAKAESRSKSPSVKKNKPSVSSKGSSKGTGKGTGNDDLTLIVGIGKVYQGKLKKIGVTSFEQIAAWTKQDADSVETQLGLGGRITNEKWIKQAKALAKKKKKK